MKTILVLSPHPDFAEVIEAGLNREEYRIVHRIGVEEAEPLLVHGLISACILDMDLIGVQGIWVIERLRRRDNNCPIIAYTAESQSEWEEEAFLHGVTHVLTKPVRARLLGSLLERLWDPQIRTVSHRSTSQPYPLAAVGCIFTPGGIVFRPLCQRGTNAGCPARFFVHPHAFPECRGHAQTIPAVPA